jgi:hypothetical protein
MCNRIDIIVYNLKVIIPSKYSKTQIKIKLFSLNSVFFFFFFFFLLLFLLILSYFEIRKIHVSIFFFYYYNIVFIYFALFGVSLLQWPIDGLVNRLQAFKSP